MGQPDRRRGDRPTQSRVRQPARRVTLGPRRRRSHGWAPARRGALAVLAQPRRDQRGARLAGGTAGALRPCPRCHGPGRPPARPAWRGLVSLLPARFRACRATLRAEYGAAPGPGRDRERDQSARQRGAPGPCRRAVSAGDRGSLSTGGLGLALYELGLVRREQGDFAGAAVMFEECIAFHRALGDRDGMAVGLLGLSDIARDQGAAAQVRRYGEDSLALLRQLGVQWAIGFALNNLALGAYQEADLTRAFALVSESVSMFREQKADASLAEVLITLGQILRAQWDA